MFRPEPGASPILFSSTSILGVFYFVPHDNLRNDLKSFLLNNKKINIIEESFPEIVTSDNKKIALLKRSRNGNQHDVII